MAVNIGALEMTLQARNLTGPEFQKMLDAWKAQQQAARDAAKVLIEEANKASDAREAAEKKYTDAVTAQAAARRAAAEASIKSTTALEEEQALKRAAAIVNMTKTATQAEKDQADEAAKAASAARRASDTEVLAAGKTMRDTAEASKQAALDAEKARTDAAKATAAAQKAAAAEVESVLKDVSERLQTQAKVQSEVEKKAAADAAAAQKSAAAAQRQELEANQNAYNAANEVAQQFVRGIATGFGVAVPLSIGAATAAAIGFASSCVKSFTEVEYQLRGTNALLGQTGEASQRSFQQMAHDVDLLSTTLGVDAVDSAKALYEEISAGVKPGADAMALLEASARSAIGGLTDTKTAADGLTSVMKAYGVTASGVDKIADQMFETVNLGKLHYSELAQVIGLVAPLASSAGVSFDQVGAAIATMTQRGLTAYEATTSLVRVIDLFIKPTKEAQAVAASLGLELSDQALKTDGLQKSVEKLSAATHGDIDLMTSLVGEIRAARGVFALTGEAADDYTQNLNKIGDASGTVVRAQEEVDQSQQRLFERMGANVEHAKRVLGEDLAPAIKDTTAFIEGAGAALKLWPDDVPTKGQIDRMGELANKTSEVYDKGKAVGEVLHLLAEAGEKAAMTTGIQTTELSAYHDMVTKMAAGQTALTALMQDGSREVVELTDAYHNGKIGEDEYTRSLLALTERYEAQRDIEARGNIATSAAIDALVLSRHKASQELLDQQNATEQGAKGLSLYEGMLGAVQSLLDSGAISQEEYDRRVGLINDSLKAGKLALDDQTKAFIAGSISADAFAKSLISGKEGLKDLTHDEYIQKLKDIANAIQFGSVTAEDGSKAIKDLASAYESQLTQAENKAAEAAKTQANEVARSLQTAKEEYVRYGQDIEKTQREYIQRGEAIQAEHDKAYNQAIIDAQEQQKKLQETHDSDLARLDEDTAQKRKEILSEELALGTELDQKTTDFHLKEAREDEDEKTAALQRQEAFNDKEKALADDRVKAEQDAQSKIKDLYDKYGDTGRAGTGGSEIDDTRSDALKKAHQALIDAERDADDALADHKREIDAKLVEDDKAAYDSLISHKADAEQQLANRRADIEQQLSDRLADAEANRVSRVASANRTYNDDRASAAERLADQIADKDSSAKEKVSDAEREREQRQSDELDRHEDARLKAKTAAAKAAEDDAHDERVAIIEREYAEKLTAIARTAEDSSDKDERAYLEDLARIDLKHREELSDIQDEADRKDAIAEREHTEALAKADDEHRDALKRADDLYADALAKAKQVHDDALSKAQDEDNDAKDKARRREDEAKAAANDAHEDALRKQEERFKVELKSINDAKDAKLAALDEQAKKDQADFDKKEAAEVASFALKRKREDEDFATEQARQETKLQTDLANLEIKYAQDKKKIDDKYDADVDASNDALVKKQAAVDAKRVEDYAKFDQDLKDRFSDLETQFTDAMSKLNDAIPDDVKKLLNGGVAAIAAAAANIMAAIPHGGGGGGGSSGGGGTDPSAPVTGGTDNGNGGTVGGAQSTTGSAGEGGGAQILNGGASGGNYGFGIGGSGGYGAGSGSPTGGMFGSVLNSLNARIAAQRVATPAPIVGGDALTPSNHVLGAGVPRPSFGSAVNPQDATAWALSQVGSQAWNLMCERFVENAYGTTGVFGSALAASKALMTHQGGSLNDAPRNSLVYFRPDASNEFYGHVGISLGGGQFVSAINNGVSVQGNNAYWKNLYAGYGEPNFTARSGGGPILPFQTYRVGEHGPETFRASVPGTIIPTGASATVRVPEGSGSVYHLYFTGPLVGKDITDIVLAAIVEAERRGRMTKVSR